MAWEELFSVYQYAADVIRDERTRVPQACPNDGTPLIQGAGGTLRCTFDGWQWPEGQVVEEAPHVSGASPGIGDW